jgi:hypothetical protein
MTTNLGTQIPAPYTTQLGAGLGAIQETLGLLHLWSSGMSASALCELAVSGGIFSRATARRTRNLVMEMFAPRFLNDDGRTAAQLKNLVEAKFPHEALSQLFFLQTARAQVILRDFVVDVYWPKYSAGAAFLVREDAERLIFRGLDSGRMAKRWSAEMIERVAQYLVGCCVDFGLLGIGNKVQRPFQRFAARHDVSLYIAHDLHFSGVSDSALIQHRDWLLFGFDPGEVLNRLKTLSNNGHFLIQSSGELVQISWKYRSMNDCLHALTQK